MRVVDRWGIGGVTPTLCVTPPHGRRACEPVAFAAASPSPAGGFGRRRAAPGASQLRVRDRGVRKATVSRSASGGAATAAPTVLATGDSTMQGIDGFLGDELGDGASVVSDVRIGTAISKSEQPSLPDAGDPAALQWGLLAASRRAGCARSRRSSRSARTRASRCAPPDGASVACCDAPWAAEYTRRVRLMMQTYARAGRARVLWLTLPLPRDDGGSP